VIYGLLGPTVGKTTLFQLHQPFSDLLAGVDPLPGHDLSVGARIVRWHRADVPEINLSPRHHV